MKTIALAALLLMAFCSVSFGTDFTSLGFRAISSAQLKTCTAFGMGDRMRGDGYYRLPIQGFSPDSAYSRSFALGTKGFGNYSTRYPGNVTLTAVKYTCVVTGTDTPAPVKVYLNHTETYFLTNDNDVLVVGR